MRTRSEALSEATDVFLGKFPKKLDVGAETIGSEPEMLAVNSDGTAATLETVQQVFNDFVTDGWKPIIDEGTSAIVGVSRDETSFTTDVGHAVIEVQIAPAQTLQEAFNLRSKALSPIVAGFAKYDVSLLGYGVLPVNKPNRNLRAPKGRYVFFERDSHNDHVPEEDGVDLHLFAMSAAGHGHFGMDQERIIAANNVLNQLGAAFQFLSANAPIWKGQIDPNGNRAIREKFWDWGWGATRSRQIGIMPPMHDMAAYVEHLASFAPQMIKGEHEYLSVRKAAKDVGELLTKGSVIASRVNGEEVQVNVPPEYILFAGGFAWHAARPAWPGTIESRITCQQPPDAPFAMYAVALGLISNLTEALKLAESRPYQYWRQLRNDAMVQGFQHPDAIELCERMISIADVGLHHRNHGEEVYLDTVKERLANKRAPADDAISAFKAHGVEGLIDRMTITNQSLI